MLTEFCGSGSYVKTTIELSVNDTLFTKREFQLFIAEIGNRNFNRDLNVL
jgi:hypothetical protein